jgi:CRP/FNR family transcriptional regulator, cyclic AMP receptor protein
MSTITDLAGFLASAMVLLTFMANDMRLLRVLGIVSNMAFITYGVLAWLPPVLCLHLLLLPVNSFRLYNLLAEKGLQDVALSFCQTRSWNRGHFMRKSRCGSGPFI